MGWRDWFGLTTEEAPAPSYSGATREALPSEYDPDRYLSATQLGSAYVRRLTGERRRDLPKIKQERALEISFHLYDTNPLGKRATELIVDYVVGEGIQVRATDQNEPLRERIQQVIDGFWDDPVNRMDQSLDGYVRELSLTGEAFYPVFVNPVDGFVRLGYLDPAEVERVVTNPENAKEAIRIEMKPPSPGEPGKCYKVVSVEQRPADPWYGRLKTAGMANVTSTVDGQPGDPRGMITETYTDADGNERPYAGSVLMFAVNKITNGTRGRPDLLASADWMDLFDQSLFNEGDRAFLMKSFIWDVLLTGAGPSEIEEFLKQGGQSPPPAAVRVHNEKVKWDVVTPDLKAHDAQILADLLLSYAATGAGLPKTFLNGQMDVNKASAREFSEPALKHLTKRQLYVRQMVESIIRFVLDQAEITGALPKRENAPNSRMPEPWAFTVNAPELIARDLASAATVLAQVSQALELLRQGGAIDLQVEQEAVALVLSQLGVEIDVDEMRKRIEEQAAAKQAEEEETDPFGTGDEEEEPLPLVTVGRRNGSEG